MDDVYSFTLFVHQIFFGILCIFYLFIAWNDYKTRPFILEKKQLLNYLALFLTYGVGIFFYLWNAWQYEGLVFAIEFAVLLTLSLYAPKYGVSFLLFLMISRPWETYQNQMMNSMPRDVSYFVLITFIGHQILHRRFYFRWNFGCTLMFLFSAWMFFSIIVSNHISYGILQYNEIFIKGIVLFFLMINIIEKKGDVFPAKISLILAIMEKAFVSYHKTFLTELPFGIFERITRLVSVGILENPNDIAAIFVLAIPFTIYFFLNMKIKILAPMLAILSFLLYAKLVWYAQSRGAILGIASLIGAVAFVKISHKKLKYFGILGILLTSIIVIKSIKRDASDLEGSTNNRIIYWKSGINMGLKHPFFGVGFFGYNRNFSSYAVGTIGSEGKNRTIHSNWLLPLAEGGVPAFTFYMLLWAYILYLAIKLIPFEPEYFYAVICYGVTITFLSQTYLLYPYILAGLIICTYMSHREESENFNKKSMAGDYA